MERQGIATNGKDVVTDDPMKYIREILKLTADKNEIPDFSRKGESFWKRGCSPNIFRAHPDAVKGILYREPHGEE